MNLLCPLCPGIFRDIWAFKRHQDACIAQHRPRVCACHLDERTIDVTTSPEEISLDHHPCEHPGCDVVVCFDDEPFCFTHSPDEGSFVVGYSFKATERKP